MRTAFAALCLSALCSCAPSPPAGTTSATVAAPAPPAPPPPPPVTDLPATFTLKQRTQVDVPGSSGALKLSIDDITRDQVRTSVRNGDKLILQPVSMAQADRVTFEYQKWTYDLTLMELNNALIGQDFATFKLAGAAAEAVLGEQQKIDRLIARVESLEGAKFIRNGTEHSPADAAKHLRDKRGHAGDKLKTAEEFIDQIGSRSSLSGEEYTIKYADGRIVKAGEFLRAELKKLAPGDRASEAKELKP